MTIEATTWLFVVIQKKGSDEQIVGQVDRQLDIAYIPAFLSKEVAQQAMYQLDLEKKNTYEVQAIIYEDLGRHAADNGFLILVLDENGKILERLPGRPSGE